MENAPYIFQKLDHIKTMPELLSHGCPTPEHNFAELQVGAIVGPGPLSSEESAQ